MDTTDREIRFDEHGVCNHCRECDKIADKHLFVDEAQGKVQLDEIANRMKRDGLNKTYDCVLGLSGGIDSSYSAYIAKQLGLRVLAIHLENGWDFELAVKNIENILKRTGFDLYTHVIDWQEFKDLQLSFLKASVVDIEMLSDHAITACIYRVADENNIKYILSGNNIATETVMPKSWKHRKSDLKNIRGIHKIYGKYKIKSFPTASTLRLLFYEYLKGIKMINILNYVHYNKERARKILEAEFGWRYYGEKHYESNITKFYQAYILPEKFGIDKRRAHYSSLICSGQMNRDEALALTREEPYIEEELQRDKAYFLKKLELTDQEFEHIMSLPVKSHLDYPSDEKLFGLLRTGWKLIRYFSNKFGSKL